MALCLLVGRPGPKTSEDPTHSIVDYNPLVAGCIADIVGCCMLAVDHHTEGNRRPHIPGPGILPDCIDFGIPQTGRSLLHIAESSARAERIVLRVGMNLRQGGKKLLVAVAGY